MQINDTVIVFCGKTGEILKIGKLESVEMEYSWATYIVDGVTFNTVISVTSEPKFVIITEEHQKVILRNCAAAYAEYVLKLTRFMLSKVTDDDYGNIMNTLTGIESLILDRANEMELGDEIDRVKRIWNLNEKKPDQYNMSEEVSIFALEKATKAIAKQTKRRR